MRWQLQILLTIGLGCLAVWCAGSLAVVDDKPVPESSADGYRVSILQELIEQRYLAVRELLTGRKTIPDTIARFRAIAEEDPFPVARRLQDLFPDVSNEDDLFLMQICLYARTVAHREGFDDSCLQPLGEELRRRGRTVPW